MNTKTLIGGISLVAIAIVIAFAVTHHSATPVVKQEPVAQKLTSTAFYMCTNNRTIAANYYDSEIPEKPAPGQPPTPSGSVKIALSENRSLELPQTISASGVRYANKDETIVFWNKGRGVTLTEGGTQTYVGCMEAAANTGDLDHVYGDAEKGMTIRYASLFTVDTNYTYQGLGPNKTISGVKFTIPSSMATGTNLSTDSYLSVEQLANTPTCTADLFLDMAKSLATTTITEGDMTYSVATSTGAGAGNRYEETVYALPGTNPCIAVRYFIHYGVIDNYPKTVKEYDRAALISEFDAMRKTLIIGQ